ncbi:MAG: M23 family metallopeptidase [Spirochaetaceae bacterium]|jgi:murein DD-endopeptidase MepM/ murein hydrolase activator NlpD|nr:M23 family metallopeptidase [Spirochaetaceae bacterium]
MFKKKKITYMCLAVLALAVRGRCFAKEALFSGDQYSIQVEYNDAVAPGDAVFVRMIISRPKKLAQAKQEPCKGTLSLEGKSADFFEVPPRQGKKSNSDIYAELLACLPLPSDRRKPGETELTVAYSAFGADSRRFTLPLVIQKKDFLSETIPLNETNTAIRTDTSPKRLAQIDALNAIFSTTRADAVFQQGPFSPPTDATRRTAFFGDRRVYVYANGKSSTSEHYGIDYGVPRGTPVHASGAGRVVMAEDRITTGWSVVIEHLPGLYSLYYHMDSIAVKVNQTVKMGDEIGKSGATGLATGPHLHWEMRLNSVAVNPDFFTGDFAFFNK